MAVKLGRSRYSENAAQRRRDKAADLHDDAVESDSSASTVSSSIESESESAAMAPPKVRFMEPKSKARAGPVLSLTLRGAEKEKSGHTLSKDKERGRCNMSADNRRKQTPSLRDKLESLRSKNQRKERGKQNQKKSSPREEGERSKDKNAEGLRTTAANTIRRRPPPAKGTRPRGLVTTTASCRRRPASVKGRGLSTQDVARLSPHWRMKTVVTSATKPFAEVNLEWSSTACGRCVTERTSFTRTVTRGKARKKKHSDNSAVRQIQTQAAVCGRCLHNRWLS